MGAAAAAAASEAIRAAIANRGEAAAIFAAAPSQNEMLAALAADGRVDFSRLIGFHMDEYIGLPADAPQGFGNFLRARMFGLKPFRTVHYLNGNAVDPEAACRAYAALLAATPPDVVLMGIGENGHIAFNDPWIADFGDPLAVKVAPLDEVCRMQQVIDGCFESLNRVPTRALTLTIPTLIASPRIVCTVPGPTKAWAVRDALTGPISPACPASILRTHPGAELYLDEASAALLTYGEGAR
jgi:glucosamine-6-phosphate deaminase